MDSTGTVSGTVTGRPDVASPLVKGSRAWIKAQAKEAAWALRVLPLTALDRPAQLKAAMPEIVRNAGELMAAQVGLDDDERRSAMSERNRPRLKASPQQIAALDMVVDWLLWMTGDQARELRIVFMAKTVQRVSPDDIADTLRCSRRHVYDLEDQAISLIVRRMKK